jgi:hypothetical protein
MVQHEKTKLCFATSLGEIAVNVDKSFCISSTDVIPFQDEDFSKSQ